MSIEISVLIPCYNVEQYIERCLLSVLKNTIIDKSEIIIVNDCTTDNSINICKKILAHFPNINARIIEHEKNMGLGKTRQTALENASGKYIICVDSDDWVEPDFLERLYYKAIETDADVVGCGWFEETDKSQECIKLLENSYEKNIKGILTGTIPPMVWIKLFRKSIFLENNFGWDEKVNILEDDLISLKYFSFARKFANVALPLYHYNMTNPASLSKNRNIHYSYKAIDVYKKTETFFIKNNILNIQNNPIDELIFAQIIQKYFIINKAKFFFQLRKLNFTVNELDAKYEKRFGKNTMKICRYIYNKNYFKAFILFYCKKLNQIIRNKKC